MVAFRLLIAVMSFNYTSISNTSQNRLIWNNSLPDHEGATHIGTGIAGSTTGAVGGALSQSTVLRNPSSAQLTARPGKPALPSISLVVGAGLKQAGCKSSTTGD